MFARKTLTPQEALACTMVLVAAADGAITDREIGAMSSLVQTLPAFQTFSADMLDHASEAAINLLRESNGLAHGSRLIREALEPRLRETAYALACDVIAADHGAKPESLQMLDYLMNELQIDPLVAAAIERGARARHRTC